MLACALDALLSASAGYLLHVPWNAPAASGVSTPDPVAVRTNQPSRGAGTPPRCNPPALSTAPALGGIIGVGLGLSLPQHQQPRRGLCQRLFPRTLVEWLQVR